MSLEHYLSGVVAACREPDGADHTGQLPSSVVKDLSQNLPPNSSWYQLVPDYTPPADVLLDVVVSDTVHGSRYVLRNVMVTYPHGSTSAPVFYSVATGQNYGVAIELHGRIVTHWAVALMELPPEPVVVNEP